MKRRSMFRQNLIVFPSLVLTILAQIKTKMKAYQNISRCCYLSYDWLFFLEQ
jgi:hypothetical protein